MAGGGWDAEELGALAPAFALAATRYSSPWETPRGELIADRCTAVSRAGEVLPLHRLKSHGGRKSAVSSDAPDAWRIPHVPLIDNRLGFPATYLSDTREVRVVIVVVFVVGVVVGDGACVVLGGRARFVAARRLLSLGSSTATCVSSRRRAVWSASMSLFCP
jgi:hypothetical protein